MKPCPPPHSVQQEDAHGRDPRRRLKGPFLFNYPEDAFAKPDQDCDLIMKAG